MTIGLDGGFGGYYMYLRMRVMGEYSTDRTSRCFEIYTYSPCTVYHGHQVL